MQLSPHVGKKQATLLSVPGYHISSAYRLAMPDNARGKLFPQQPFGGIKIPEHKKSEVKRRIEQFAAENYAVKFTRLEIRFRGKLCQARRCFCCFCYVFGVSNERPNTKLRRCSRSTNVCRLGWICWDTWFLTAVPTAWRPS